ncbi:MAG: secondary thiamine-phosphate synthase enzyme [Patiriisocius sp.]
MIKHYKIEISRKNRGYHIITDEVLDTIMDLPSNGLLNLFIQHTSASIMINENADPTVREDLEQSFNRLVKEDEPWYKHTIEGSDDMPAHIKGAMIGFSMTIPIENGRLMLGTWQGIYLCEFRNNAGARKLVATVYS